MAYTKYSLTPADNNAAPPNGAPEGMLPSAVNDTMRDMMAQIRDVGDGIRGGTYTMTAPVITGGSVTGSTINNSAIGGTTAAAGKFTTLEATGVTTVQAGTVSAPAITTTGDTNTGIFFPAADTIAFTEGGVESMRIDSSGNLLVNTTTTITGPGKVQIAFNPASFVGIVTKPTSDTATHIQFLNAAGTQVGYIATAASSTAYVTSSDYRLKENIEPMTGALATVAALKPVTYKWKIDGSAGQGFIAHELAEVVPDCVTGEKDAVDEEGNPKYQGIDTSFLVATLTAAIQELKAEFDAYKATHP